MELGRARRTLALAHGRSGGGGLVVRSCRKFFEAQAEDDEEEEDAEGNVARFFGELLGGDAALRGFYEAEPEKGQFLCLVCEGSGARVGKRFSGCIALVQHAASVARTKRRLSAVGQLIGMERNPGRAASGKHFLAVPLLWSFGYVLMSE
jgi:hypothetical protein